MHNQFTTFAEQINVAQHQAMQDDAGMICMGLGIDDPKAIFSTTAGLQQTFGSERVFDTPTAENAMTGIAIGAAIAGTRVLMTHQRVDFFLLAMDQLVNNAAKWHYMFNGTMQVPLTIRLIIGRGWGQGPTHQQSLQNWFAHIPGLKVVTPGRAENASALLYQSIMDSSPTIFLEHRWLHQQTIASNMCEHIKDNLSLTSVIKKGDDITIIANSYMLVEALLAQKHFEKYGVACEIIELASPTQIDWEVINTSVRKTGHCIICDIGHQTYSVASDIAAKIYNLNFGLIKKPIEILALPLYPEPTSYGMTKTYYKTHLDISISINKLLNKQLPLPVSSGNPHDVPGDWFKGPF